MLSTDEEIKKALYSVARGGISYFSPRLRPMLVELFESRKRSGDNLPVFPVIPATMNWYNNFGYLGDGFGRLEGLPDSYYKEREEAE